MRRIGLVVGMVALLGLPWPARADAEGEPVRLLTLYTLSPDGATFVFAWRGDLWSTPLAGGPVRRLTNHPGTDARPHFSPDGSQIAFTSTRSGSEQVWVMNADGTGARIVTTHSEGTRVYGWYPDGQHLLTRAQRDHHWRRNHRLFKRKLRPEVRPELLFDDYGYVCDVAPDGHRIAFTREGVTWWRKGYRGPQSTQIWIHDSDDGSFTRVSEGDHGERWPLWMPGGRHLLLVSQQDGTWNLYRHDLETGAREQLTTHKDDAVVFPVLSEDGKTIVYRRGFDTYALKLDANGTPTAAPRRLDIRVSGDPVVETRRHVTETRATDVAFADDAREIAFIAGGDLWVMDTELKEPRRVTASAAEEREPVFSEDFQTLYFLSEAGGQCDIWKAERSDEDKYWWQNDRFKLTRLTEDAPAEEDLRLIPGKRGLAFVRTTGGLWRCDLDGKNPRALVTSWDAPDYSFSPDGSWLAYAVSDNDFNSDVWLQPTDGSQPPVNVSMHPDYDSEPVWSPDGRMLAFTGRRWGEESDICLVYLQNEFDEQRKRDRTLEKALKKMASRDKEKGGNDKKKGASKAPAFAGTWTGTLKGAAPLPKDGLPLTLEITAPDNEADAGWRAQVVVPLQLDVTCTEVEPSKDGKTLVLKGPSPLGAFEARLTLRDKALTGTWRLGTVVHGELEARRKKGAKKPKTPAQRVDLDRIEDRVRRIPIADADERGLLWSPDSKKLAFMARIEGAEGLYTISPPDDLKPKRLVAGRGSHARWLKTGNQIAWLSGGSPATVSAKGKVTRYGFRVQRIVDEHARHEAAFDIAWRTMRDSFYDPGMAGRDWNAIRKKYRPMAAACATRGELEEVCNLMLGELNASHMGFRALGGTWVRPGWKPVTAHLGLQFDHDAEGLGLRVRHVVRDGPADQDRSRVRVGERVLQIDGYHVSTGTNLTRLLTLDRVRDIRLRVQGTDEKERDVTLRPVSYGVARNLLYDDWLARTRARVDAASKGTLGYLHVRGMNWSSFERFEAELYKIGHGKDGLIIDVRENGGGFTTDHLLTCLTQPQHAFTIPRGGGRGYPQGRMVYARWNKPIVVLCNQNSFSNAEIFSHAIKTLGRGRVVGVTTAGGVISTGGRRIMGIATLRMPFRGWFLRDTGHDMELNGCVPHIEVWPEPGDWGKGIDRQLDAGIQALAEDVKKWKARPLAQPRVAPKPWPPR